MTDDERIAAVFEVTKTGFEALGDAYETLGARTDEALSAVAHYLAEAAVNHDVDMGAFLMACEEAYTDARERAGAEAVGGKPS